MSTYPEVTLEQILAAREARVARQQAELAAHGLPLISVSLVMPGPVKAGMLPRQLMLNALTAIDRSLTRGYWPTITRNVLWLPTGPEALYTVNAPAEGLKRAMVALEERHPLGRLWDLDVISTEGQISRSALGLAPRTCLVCDQPAHACARSRAHSLDTLLNAIREKVDAVHRQSLVA